MIDYLGRAYICICIYVFACCVLHAHASLLSTYEDLNIPKGIVGK